MEQWENNWADYYAELRCSPADPIEVILALYRALAKVYHPDGGSRPDAEMMKRVNAARDVLSDPDARARYDEAHRKRAEDADAERRSPPDGAKGENPRTPPGPENDEPAREPTDLAAAQPRSTAPSGGRTDDTRSSGPKQEPRAANQRSGPEPAAPWHPSRPAATFTVSTDRTVPIDRLLNSSGFQVGESYRALLARYEPPTNRPSRETLDIGLIQVGLSDMSGNEFLAEIHELGYRPIDLIELLSLAAQHAPNLRRYPKILALGDPWIIPLEKSEMTDWDYNYRRTPIFAVLAHNDDSSRHVWVTQLSQINRLSDSLFWPKESGFVGVVPR